MKHAVVVPESFTEEVTYQRGPEAGEGTSHSDLGEQETGAESWGRSYTGMGVGEECRPL